MGVLDVEIQGAGHRVGAVRNIVKGRVGARDNSPLQGVTVLVKIGEAKDAICSRVFAQLLNNQIVLLASLDICLLYTSPSPRD